MDKLINTVVLTTISFAVIIVIIFNILLSTSYCDTSDDNCLNYTTVSKSCYTQSTSFIRFTVNLGIGLTAFCIIIITILVTKNRWNYQQLN